MITEVLKDIANLGLKHCWDVFISLNCMTKYSKWLMWVLKAVFHSSLSCILTGWYALRSIHTATDECALWCTLGLDEMCFLSSIKPLLNTKSTASLCRGKFNTISPTSRLQCACARGDRECRQDIVGNVVPTSSLFTIEWLSIVMQRDESQDRHVTPWQLVLS